MLIKRAHFRVLAVLVLASLTLAMLAQTAATPAAAVAPVAIARPESIWPKYFPARDAWLSRPAADVGMDPAALAAAVEWAKARENDMPRDFSTQRQIFGRPLGPVPTTRALTNGLVLRHGYIVAEWGDTLAVDPTYSVAKSYLSTLLGLAIDRGLIASIEDLVATYVADTGPGNQHDSGYDSPHNAKITWAHHVTQTSEWDGELFGKVSTFIGTDEFGQGARKPRDLLEPGKFYEYNDVRVNRFSMSLMKVWKRPLPEVLKSEIMDKIGASDTWTYHGYSNSTIEFDGKPMTSVGGGTRWGGGLWISTRDHARLGLLMLRKGEWAGERILSEKWIESATTPKGKAPGYGYLWWLNAEARKPDHPFAWKGAPARSYAAQGAGGNTVWVDPEHDLVVVWRWHAGDAENEFYSRIVGAINPD